MALALSEDVVAALHRTPHEVGALGIFMSSETALSDTGKSAAISVTRASASAKRARMARRVGSAIALKAASSRPER